MAKVLEPMVLHDSDTGEEYILRFTRSTVRKLEAAGFDITQLDSKGMTNIPLLFWGAFLAERPFIKQNVTDDILANKLGGLTAKELKRLGELYAEPFNTLILTEDEPTNPRKMTVAL